MQRMIHCTITVLVAIGLSVSTTACWAFTNFDGSYEETDGSFNWTLF